MYLYSQSLVICVSFFFLNPNAYQRLSEVLAVSEIKAPMAGKIIEIKVNVGDAINEGDEVVVLEAMKMELPVVAEVSGTVKEINCTQGTGVDGEAVLVILE